MKSMKNNDTRKQIWFEEYESVQERYKKTSSIQERKMEKYIMTYQGNN